MDPVVADELPRSVGRVARLKLGKSNVHRLNASRIYIEISLRMHTSVALTINIVFDTI